MNLPYDYTSAVLYAIDLISIGKTKTAACDDSNISVGTFERYLKNDEQLQELYTEAFQRGTDAMADALLEIDRDKTYGHSDPKMAKVVSDNIKWFLAKRRPKDFGDRIEVKHTLTADKAITQALIAGQQRALSVREDEEIIEAEFFEIDEDEEMAELFT